MNRCEEDLDACLSKSSFLLASYFFFFRPLHKRIQATNSNVAQPGFLTSITLYYSTNPPTFRYEAHRDECLACFDALCVHWKEAKGRGHPAAVAALNSVAEVLTQYTKDGHFLLLSCLLFEWLLLHYISA